MKGRKTSKRRWMTKRKRRIGEGEKRRRHKVKGRMGEVKRRRKR
jgi:hypothetical protein